MVRLSLLDYLRFFAAIFVVLFHYTFNGINNGKLASVDYMYPLVEISRYGYLGVELFFMISGYVIFRSLKGKSASEFVLGRLIRLYPAYWFAVIFTTIVSVYYGGDLMKVDLVQFFVNLSMLQSFFDIKDVDGVYWTLGYELRFYGAVAILLALGLQKSLRRIFLVWPICMAIASIVGWHSVPGLGGYYYYFSAGAVLAIAAEKIDRGTVLSMLVIYILCLRFSIEDTYNVTALKGFYFSPLIVGVLVTIFFVLLLVQNWKTTQGMTIYGSKLMGSLSYPIYLIHAHFGYMILNNFANNDNIVGAYIVLMVVLVIIALIVHVYIEKSFSSFWRGIFVRFVDLGIGAIDRVLFIFKRIFVKQAV